MKPSVRLVRVILDTNILYSALHSGGQPLALLEMCMKHQRLIACVSTALLYEYEEVLKGKLPEINQSRKVKGWNVLTRRDIDGLLEDMTACSEKLAIYLRARPSLEDDPDDEFVVELAAMSGAIICTGNVKDFLPAIGPYRLRVVKPAEMLEMMKS